MTRNRWWRWLGCLAWLAAVVGLIIAAATPGSTLDLERIVAFFSGNSGVVASRNLSPLTTLADGDLQAYGPTAVARKERLVGRVLLCGVGRETPVSASHLKPIATSAPGATIMSLAAKGDVAWLTPGDPVRLFPSQGAGTATPATPGTATGIEVVILQVGATGKDSTPLLVAVPPTEAERARGWLMQGTAVVAVYGLTGRGCP